MYVHMHYAPGAAGSDFLINREWFEMISFRAKS